MRFHGIHVQGLRAPAGRHRLQFDPRYNVIIAPDARAASALVALMRAFLYPRTDLGNLEIWGDPGAGQPARAGVSLTFGGEAYRLIVDLEKQRVVLGRYDRKLDRYERVSAKPAAIEACLHGAGLPSREEFMVLQMCEGRASSSAPSEPVPERELAAKRDSREEVARLMEELWGAEELRRARDEAEQRLAQLTGTEERRASLERDQERLALELEQFAPLRGMVNDLEPQMERFRELESVRARERDALQQSRRELFDERTALRSIPSRQIFPIWTGAALALLGLLAGLAGYTLLYLFAPLGAITVGSALYASWDARRRMSTVEASLAALRVRGRSVDRDFETESAPVRELLQALKLGTLEELARAAADYRGVLARVREVEHELDGLRASAGEGTAEEMRRLEARLVSLADAPDPAEIQALLDRLPRPDAEAARSDPPIPSEAEPQAAPDGGPASSGAPGPDELIRAASLAIGRSEREIIERLAPVHPIYLRALSGGRFRSLQRREIDGWMVHGEEPGDVTRYEDLPERERARVQMASRLAILESIAPDLSVPLVLGPPALLEHEEDMLALARTLHRLGSAVQVIHIASGEAAWAEQAHRLLILSPEEPGEEQS